MGQRLSQLRQLAQKRLSDDQLVDGGFLAGLAAISVGCGWIYPPLLLIVGGSLLATICWRTAKAAKTPPPATRVIERTVIGPDDDEDEDY